MEHHQAAAFRVGDVQQEGRLVGRAPAPRIPQYQAVDERRQIQGIGCPPAGIGGGVEIVVVVERYQKTSRAYGEPRG